jgi:hypothetical protein
MSLLSFLPSHLNTTALWRSIPSRTPQKRNFVWQAKHQFCDCSVYTSGSSWMTGTKTETQGRKEEGKRGRVSGTQLPSGGRKATYGTCEKELPWIHKNSYDVSSCTEGVKGLRSRGILENGEKPLEYAKIVTTETSEQFASFSNNVDEIGCFLPRQVCWQRTKQEKYRTTYRFYVMYINTEFIRIDCSKCHIEGVKGFRAQSTCFML